MIHYIILYFILLSLYQMIFRFVEKKERLINVKFSISCDLQIELQSENIDSSTKRKVRILLQHNFSYRITHNVTYA